LSLIKKNFDGSYVTSKISLNCGCTANVVLITPNKIITANAGDSRSVLCRKGNSYPLSEDHKPEGAEEYRRIKYAGGQIINGRVNGGLNLSRSFGDFTYKQNSSLKYD
jgi:serine/threonine protein phosphatase PrpC